MLKNLAIASIVAFATASSEAERFLSGGCEQCSAPNNCYHPTWGSPCSCASDESACTSSSSGAKWCPPGPPTPPGPTPSGDKVVGGYLGLYGAEGLDRLQALADNATTLPVNRLWLAFTSPLMVYEPGTNSLQDVGFKTSSKASDAGFSIVKDAIKKLTAGGVEVFISMGGWNYNCFPYFYANNSVAGYGAHTPNFWKIQQFGQGDVKNCNRDNQFCYVCEPPSEKSDLDRDFGLFPEPNHSEGWNKAEAYVAGKASGPAPEWNHTFVPGQMVTDKKTGTQVKVPGSDKYIQMSRDPYKDLVYLAKDLGATGVDIDYEEVWHADTFKTVVKGAEGPWELHQTTYKYAAIMKDVMDSINMLAPEMKLSTTPGAVGAWEGNWWGGNLKGMWLQTMQQFPEIVDFMSKGKNAGGLNIMTYDVSSNEDFHECPGDKDTCPLDKQVDFYMQTYKKAGMNAFVGYEIGQPAYPDKQHDGDHQLPLTNDMLKSIIDKTQGEFAGGFFWDMYKKNFAGQPSPTQVAQAICNKVLPGNARCSGTIPEVMKSTPSFPIQ